jgi:hypothetical protein
MRLSRVVLPHPEWPITHTNSLRRIERSTSSTAVNGTPSRSKVFETPSTVMATSLTAPPTA